MIVFIQPLHYSQDATQGLSLSREIILINNHYIDVKINNFTFQQHPIYVYTFIRIWLILQIRASFFSEALKLLLIMFLKI